MLTLRKLCFANLLSFLFYTQEKRVLSLDVGLLIAGAKERGELEARVTTLIREILKEGGSILNYI
jgi:ATP-dependent Clp protease ATP-binding subunit ClpA